MKKYWKVSLLAVALVCVAAFVLMEKAPILSDPALPDEAALLAAEQEVPLAEDPDQAEDVLYQGLNETQIKYVKEVLALVNQARKEAGVAPLVLDPALREAAQVRAKECVKVFSHTRPDGSSYKTALQAVGITPGYCGENVGTGYKTPEKVVAGWMKSAGHKANILNGNYTKIGIGLEKNTGNRYGGYAWAQLFVK